MNTATGELRAHGERLTRIETKLEPDPPAAAACLSACQLLPWPTARANGARSRVDYS